VKHGGYSRTTLLPGEDPAAFEKLHNDLVAEFEAAWYDSNFKDAGLKWFWFGAWRECGGGISL
jgi:hypothetical protein